MRPADARCGCGSQREHLERAIAVALELPSACRIGLPARGVRCACGALAALTLVGKPVCEQCFNAGRARLAHGGALSAEAVRAIDKKVRTLLGEKP